MRQRKDCCERDHFLWVSPFHSYLPNWTPYVFYLIKRGARPYDIIIHKYIQMPRLPTFVLPVWHSEWVGKRSRSPGAIWGHILYPSSGPSPPLQWDHAGAACSIPLHKASYNDGVGHRSNGVKSWIHMEGSIMTRIPWSWPLRVTVSTRAYRLKVWSSIVLRGLLNTASCKHNGDKLVYNKGVTKAVIMLNM